MKHRFPLAFPPIVLALLLAALFSCTPDRPPVPGDPAAALASGVPVLLERYRVPGAAVAVVSQGRVVWAQGFARPGEAPVTERTIFQAASVSKSLGAWAVLRLAEQGRVDLDVPISRYLHRWNLPPSAFSADGVTLRRILSHTAGLSVGGYGGWAPTAAVPSLEASLSGGNGGAGPLVLASEPGKEFSYSGGGYTLMQLAVEEVTGERFADYMKREVLDPLGMKSSAFEFPSYPPPGATTGHDVSGRPVPYYHFTELAAAGLQTTAQDLAAFTAAFMEGPRGEPAGRGVVSPGTLALAARPVAELDSLQRLFGGESMGLGHFVERLPDGTPLVSHGGSNRGWKLHYFAAPARGAGVVILTNSDRGAALTAEAAGLWGQAAGVGEPGLTRGLRTVSWIVGGIAGVFALLAVLFAVLLVRGLASGRRGFWPVLLFRGQGRIGAAAGSLALGAVCAFFGRYLVGQPVVQTYAPAAEPWLSGAVAAFAAGGLLLALFPRRPGR